MRVTQGRFFDENNAIKLSDCKPINKINLCCFANNMLTTIKLVALVTVQCIYVLKGVAFWHLAWYSLCTDPVKIPSMKIVKTSSACSLPLTYLPTKVPHKKLSFQTVTSSCEPKGTLFSLSVHDLCIVMWMHACVNIYEFGNSPIVVWVLWNLIGLWGWGGVSWRTMGGVLVWLCFGCQTSSNGTQDAKYRDRWF